VPLVLDIEENVLVPPPEVVILALKIAVIAVTALLAGSLTALALGNYQLHGRINLVFSVLVFIALAAFELTAHVLSPGQLQEYLSRQGALTALYIHLGFSVPSALVLPAMLFTGKTHRRRIHVPVGMVFLLLWSGTFVTGIFYLPHVPVSSP
jgi:uncharacterized membrane protein YozB (DUF420 family)